MFGSFPIGQIAGIRLRLHWTFVALVFVMVWSAQTRWPLALAFTGLLFVAVLFHELGHGLVARRFGVRVADISFGPFGGMARLIDPPDQGRVEGWIAAAGPLVNLALAGASFALFALSAPAGGADSQAELRALADPLLALDHALQRIASGQGSRAALRSIALVFWNLNLYLGLFNLLPAFPLDGGRILRSLLSARLDWPSATAATVRTSFWAILLGLVGIAIWRSDLLCLSAALALFGWSEGARELWSVRLRYAQSPLSWFGGSFQFGGARAGRAAAESAAEAEVEPPPQREAARASEDEELPSGRGQARRPRLWSAEELRDAEDADERLRNLEDFRGRLRPPRDPDPS